MRLAAVALALATHAGAIELTPADWDEKTAGKSVFVKFFAPWCGHCKSMKPAWDQLMAEYVGHESILVADVDCIGDGSDLCDKVGVEGFPTIKYGDPNSLEDYDGGRDYEDLSAFAKQSLGPTCGPANLDLCDDDKKAQIDKLMAMPAEELQAAIDEKDDLMKKAEKEFETFVEGLQSQYEEAEKKKEDTKKQIRESGLGLFKSVQAHRKDTKKQIRESGL